MRYRKFVFILVSIIQPTVSNTKPFSIHRVTNESEIFRKETFWNVPNVKKKLHTMKHRNSIHFPPKRWQLAFLFLNEGLNMKSGMNMYLVKIVGLPPKKKCTKMSIIKEENEIYSIFGVWKNSSVQSTPNDKTKSIRIYLWVIQWMKEHTEIFARW